MKIDIKGVVVPNDDKWIYDWLEMDAVSPRDVLAKIAEANGEDLEVEINSGGGDVYSGSEIYTYLKEYAGKVLVKIVGIAASASSVIAMSGDKVVMTPTGQFMMHNVSTRIEGDYRALEHEAVVLRGHNAGIANAYMLKTGMSQHRLLKLMDEATYLNAQGALKYKFIDEIMFDEESKLVASVRSTMLPPEVVNKIRNHLVAIKPDELADPEEPKLSENTEEPSGDSRQAPVELYQAQILSNRRRNDV